MTALSRQQWYLGWISIVAALGGLLFGYDTGVISGAILFIRHQFTLSVLQTEFVVSAVLMGAFVGALSSGRLADSLGRRFLIIVTALLFIVGSLLSAFTPSIPLLIFARFIVGLAIGIAAFVAPLYVAEIAPQQYRGRLVALNQLAVTMGIVGSYLIDYQFADAANWRMMLGLGVVPALILLVGMLFLPKSPRWLVLNGYVSKARQVLLKLRDKSQVEAELNAIEKSVEPKKESGALFNKRLRPVLFIGIGLAFFQQATGINTIIYYAPIIFKTAGFHHASAAILATLGLGLVNVLATVIAIPLIDKVGRRPLLLLGMTGMLVSLFLLAAGFAMPNLVTHLRWLTFASLLIYIVGFAIGLGPMAWLVIAEIFPLRVRGEGMSVASASNWGCNLLVAMTFLTLLNFMGTATTFLLYGLVTILGIAFVYFYLPETKNVSLETIEANIEAGKPMRELGESLPVVGNLLTD